MSGWGWFVLAVGVFFACHSIPLRPRVRARLTTWLGARGFGAVYGCLSSAALVWVIVAAGRAPAVMVWPWAEWRAWVSIVVMLPVCVIAALALGRTNPFSFGGGNAAAPFDPAHPGLVRWMRHPLLWVMALWAGAHVVANGDLAHVILFGMFAGFAVLGTRLVDRRKRREMGRAHWQDLWQAVAAGPIVPRPRNIAVALVRIALGLLVYVLLIALHPVVIGVSPLP